MSRPISVEDEAEAQVDRFRTLVAMAMPGDEGILDKFRPVFVRKFKAKIEKGWVPKKGWATRTAPEATVEPRVSLAEAKRILFRGVEAWLASGAEGV